VSLILLASYPKSGNTWMRALLSNYLAADKAPVPINRLVAAPVQQRHAFDEHLGLSSSIMTTDEIMRHMPRYFASHLPAGDPAVFIKVHSVFSRLPDGAPLFSSATFSGAVCIVRNPLDVAVSYAHHLQSSVDHAISVMGNPEAYLTPDGRRRRRIHPNLPERVSDWSRNTASWLDQDELPVRLVSYEQMHASPAACLETVVGFAGLQSEPARLARAADNARFENLRRQEELEGFREKQPTSPSFFRKGRIGDWRDALSRQQVRLLAERHGPVMARLGYLDEAERFLAEG